MAGLQQWRLINCFIKGFLEIKKCMLTDETVPTQLAYCCISWPGERVFYVNSTFPGRALLWKYSLPCVFHALFCTSKGFHCLKETGGRDWK